MSANRVDVPFELRHKCWFCGEPSYDDVEISHQDIEAITYDATSLQIPACEECEQILRSYKGKSVSESHRFVKNALIHNYSKHLAIGSKWTEQELIDSKFTGAAFEGFGRSAWAMYEIAKERIAFKSWQLCVDEMPIEQPSLVQDTFEYEGIQFASLSNAIDHYSKIFELSNPYLRKAVDLVGREKFSFALRYCRLYPGATDDERAEYLYDLKYTIDDEKALSEQNLD